MKKRITAFIAALEIAFLLWAAFSWLDIVLDNTKPGNTVHDNNLLLVIERLAD